MPKAPFIQRASSRGARLLAIVFLALPLLAAPEKGPASLSRTRFPAKGRNEAILDITRAGRYALVAKSKQGAQIQIVDRMVGPSGADGEAGSQDGRLDLLLDAGKYKIQILSPAKGRGEVSLEARTFGELHKPEPPILVEQKPVQESLEDFQQRSWWVQVSERRTVYLEAQGRGLADLRLWKDGAWLLDSTPQIRVAEPVKGRPERNGLLVADLNPGTYLLTAYGGPALAWAKETGAHPFHLRFGIPTLPTICRTDGLISPFGTDRYLVPSGADSYFVQLAAKRDFRLEVGSFRPGDSLGVSQASASITKKSPDPECSVRQSTSKPYALVTLSGTPGEHYVLQCLDDKDTYSLVPPEPKDYRIATIHSGYVDDNLDATGILVATGKGLGRPEVVADDAIHIGKEKGWARRFNLLGENTAFFFVEEPGDYQILSSGTEAEYRLEPFFFERPPNYSPHAYEGSGTVFPLEKGYWKLTLRPKLKGVLKVALQPKGMLQRLGEWVKGGEQTSLQPAKPGCTIPKIRLDPQVSYTLYLGRQEGVSRGAILRSLPLKLEEPLPLVLQPGREESVLLAGETECRLGITTATNAKYACYVDGKPWVDTMTLASGTHAVWVRNDGGKSLQFTLRGIPVQKTADAPPVFLTSADKKVLEARLPSVAAGSPLFVDLGVQEQRTALLSVATPGFYRIETTGLLKTSLTLRSAVRTKLFSAQANGVGRNALLSQYLKEGEYLLTVQTMEASAGHAGVKVERTEVAEEGDLTLGREAKAEILANRGVAYGFSVSKAGQYLIRTSGQGRFFPCRLEDGEGWPILTPGESSNLSQELTPGRYRFLSLPVDVDTLRLTSLNRVPEKRRLEGKGPHVLTLGEAVANRWKEPAPGANRQRDLYSLVIPADLDVRIHLGNDMMQAFLRRTTGSEPPRMIRPGKDWTGLLPAGEYRLEVECGRINDLVDYDLKVSTAQLAPGLHRTVAVPGWVEVRLAKDSIVELFSQGQMDVRGLLYEALPESQVASEEPTPPGSEGVTEEGTAENPGEPEATPERPEGEPSEGEEPPAMEGEEGNSSQNEAPKPAAPGRAIAPAPKTGALIDTNDDSYHDWNFRIARRLPAGRYLLCVESVGGQTGNIAVGMEAPAEVLRESLPTTSDRKLELGGAISVFPLDLTGKDDLLSVRVSGTSLYGCILESMGSGGPTALVTRTGKEIAFDLPTRPEGRYRLRLWSADHQSETVRLRTWSTPLPVISLEQLDRLKAPEGQGEPCKAARIRVDKGGTFRPEPRTGFTYATAADRPLAAPEDGFAALPEGQVILCWSHASHGSPRIALAREILGRGRQSIKVRLTRGIRQTVDVSGAPGESILVMAKALTGKVGCAPLSGEGQPALSRAFLLAEGFALAVVPSGPSAQVQVWDPQESTFSDSEIEIQARGFRPTASPAPLAPGVFQQEIPAGAAVRWGLPPGGKQVDLVLEDGLAAYLADGDKVQAVAFAAGRAAHASFPTTASGLVVVNLGSAKAGFGVDLRHRAEDTFLTGLPKDGILERFEPNGGTLRLEIPAAPGRYLSVAGADVTCEWMDAQGILHPGKRHEIRGGGVAQLTYGPGLVKVWTWEKDREVESRWGSAAPEGLPPLAPNSVFALESARKGFSFTVARPSALKVRWDGAAVACLRQGAEGQPTKVLTVTEGGLGNTLEAFLEPGGYTLELRAFKGETLRGTGEFNLMDVTPLTKTFGPETLVHGGETRTFAFTLPRAGTVGIGLATERDVLTCQLFKAEGSLLGTGVQQLENLPAGTYLLRISLPQGEPPLKFAPVVVGLEAPGNGPPEEVLREFLDQIGIGPR